MEEQRLLLRRKNKLITYAVPALLALLATLVKIWCFRYTGYSIPFLFYFLVLLLAGAIAGSKGVLTALFVIAIAIFTWLIPVMGAINQYTIAEQILFLIEGVSVAFLFRWSNWCI